MSDSFEASLPISLYPQSIQQSTLCRFPSTSCRCSGAHGYFTASHLLHTPTSQESPLQTHAPGKTLWIVRQNVSSVWCTQCYLQKHIALSDCQFTLGEVGLYHLKRMFLQRKVGPLSCSLLWNIQCLSSTWHLITSLEAIYMKPPFPFPCGDLPSYCWPRLYFCPWVSLRNSLILKFPAWGTQEKGKSMQDQVI